VDINGNLYVADSVNGRVLRFPQPFNFSGPMEPADLVLGQQNFVSQFTDPSSSNLARPYGLAFSGTNGLAVSDVKHNRILYFPAVNGTFSNGQAAVKVFGQSQFSAILPGSGESNLNAPRHISTDGNGRIYVADTGNNRIQIF
jgi:sugar lactone lactonase YvrE